MTNKKNRSWFVKVGPFGGLLPSSWEGFVVLIVGVSIIAGLALYAHTLSQAGDIANSQKLWLACAVSGVVFYIFAAAKSGKS